MKMKIISIVLLGLIVTLLLVYLLVHSNQGHNLDNTTNYRSKSNITGVPPNARNNNLNTSKTNPLILYHDLKKAGFIMGRISRVVLENECLPKPMRYNVKYACLNTITNILGKKYNIRLDLTGIKYLNVTYIYPTDNTTTPIDYIAIFNIKNSIIYISLKTGEAYQFFRIFTRDAFLQNIKEFRFENYANYNISYILQVLNRSIGVNLSLYGDPYLVAKKLVKDIYDIKIGKADMILYTIHLKLHNRKIFVSNALPDFRLTIYVYVIYNNKYVGIGYKFVSGIPVPRTKILYPKNCTINYMIVIRSLLREDILSYKILQKDEIYFIKTYNDEFYYTPGFILKVFVKANTSSILLALIYDETQCTIYDYTYGKY